MKKVFFYLLAFISFGFASIAHAAKIDLTHFDDNTYLLEISKTNKHDTNASILKQIAKEVQKTGYQNFLLPEIIPNSDSTSYAMLTNADQKEVQILAEAYHYQAWNVESILNNN